MSIKPSFSTDIELAKGWLNFYKFKKNLCTVRLKKDNLSIEKRLFIEGLHAFYEAKELEYIASVNELQTI